MLSSLIEPASTFAGEVDNLFLLITVITGFWFVAAEVAFFWLIFRFRHKDGVKSQYITGKEPHLKRWVTVPHGIIILLDVIIIVGAVRLWYMIKQDLPPADSTIEIIGQQWAWSFVHPGPDNQLGTEDDIKTVDELHVEVDKLYHFKLESSGRAARLLGACVPPQAGRHPGSRDHSRLVRADQGRRVRHPVRRDVRHRSRHHGRPPHRGHPPGITRPGSGEPVGRLPG